MENGNPELYFPELSPIENNMLCSHYSVDDGEEILIITIDIGDGRKDEIRVYEHDDSDQLALDFCYKHMLGARAKMLLADEIDKYLKIAISRVRAKQNVSSNRENLSQSPNRPRRNQTFTQKSMQVKRNMTNQKSISQQNKANNSVVSSKFSSVQEFSESPKSKNQRSPNRGSKANGASPNSPSPESLKKKLKENKWPKRCNSLYSKPEESKSIEKEKEYENSKSVWNPEVSEYQESRSFKSVQLYEKNHKNTENKSERIMKKIKYQRYKEIFSMLLPDAKGMISKETIYKNNLAPGLKKIISPLLDELQELNETLDFNEFYDAMEMLMKSLTPGDKSQILLPVKPKVTTEIQYDFKPKTNVGHKSVSSFSLYERSVQKKQEISRKIEKERERKVESEMKECKFSPSIVARHRKFNSSNSVSYASKSLNENL